MNADSGSAGLKRELLLRVLLAEAEGKPFYLGDLMMDIFNILAGVASIVSLVVSILAFKGVHDVKVHVGFADKSRNKLIQKASGNKIQQAGRDINV